MSFTIGSLFDGSGGFPLAATMCGGTPKWASEIEPYPIAVTKSRFPDVKHLGSVTDIKGDEVEPVDVITFGSPCQDLSVAGKRAGLKHEANGDDETTRSGLFMEAVRIIKEMREATNGVYPRFAVWENVPGAFSSNKGEDFRIVLEELIKVVEPTAVMPPVPEKGWPYADSYCGDGWSIAYRVLDAQFWGVPQRRRRIYLVADFRGECAEKVSFEREGLRGYFETGRTPWQTVAGDVEDCSGAADCERNAVTYSINHQGGNVEQIIEDKTGTLTAAMNSSGNNKLSVAYGVTTKGNGDAFISEEKHTDLSCGGGQAGQGYPCVMDPVGFDGYNSTDTGDKAATLGVNCGMSTGRNGVVYAVDQGGGKSGANFHNNLSPTLTCTHGGGKGALIQDDLSAMLATNNDQYVFQPIGIVDSIGGQAERGWEGEIAPCLKASHYKFAPCVAVPVAGFCTAGCNGKGVKEDICYTRNTIDRPAVAYSMKTIARNGKALEEQANPICASDYKDPDIVAYSLETFHCTSEEEKTTTLKARDYKDPVCVAYGVDCRNMNETPELYPTLQAKPNGGQSLNYSGAVRVQYIVRRLTPTECARLQGFPDKWGHPSEKTELTEEEYQFWLNVRNTHAAINDKATKEYTKDQMLKWYNSLHTDSSEYKMWGNGIALPNALYVMQGIADVMTEEKASRKKWLDDLLGGSL